MPLFRRNTVTVMTTSLFTLGGIEGVERPALATQIPTKKGHALMLDEQTVDCRAIHLEQFAFEGITSLPMYCILIHQLLG